MVKAEWDTSISESYNVQSNVNFIILEEQPPHHLPHFLKNPTMSRVNSK